MEMNYKEITTVSELSESEFEKNFYNASKPVIIKGGANDYKSFKKWSPDYFKSIFGNKTVDIRKSDNGVYNYHKDNVKQLFLPFDEAINYITTNNCYYLQQLSIYKNFPELVEDLDKPKWMNGSEKQEIVNLWIGGKGCVSPLHFDGLDNFLIQIKGSKEITFFAPGDMKYLYPNFMGPVNLRQISMLDLDNVDKTAFPLFEKAQPYKAVINSGDILYIPIHWWHHVKSLDLSININYWWNRINFRFYKNNLRVKALTTLGRIGKK